jgi:glycosyltransferase involved in cell wall biosynthesis
MFNKKDIILSICMITYNHEKFILEALKGVFNQKFNFKCELIIYDDCSTDSTVEIIKKYFEETDSIFDSINLNVNPTNLGVSKNFYSSLIRCNGKYIALCEGDDFWIDSLKVKKQVDFLENNDSYVMVYHPVKILDSKEYLEDYFNLKKIPETSTYNDFLNFGNYVQTCSVVFKNVVKNFPIEKVNYLNDYILWFWISQFGKVYRIDEIMSIYRFSSGVWYNLSDFKKEMHTLNTLFEVKKIIKTNTDSIVLENRIYTLAFLTLPVQLRKINYNNYDINNYLLHNITIKTILKVIYLKFFLNLFTRK